MIAYERSESLVEMETRLHNLTSQRDRLHARVAEIDAALPDLRALVGEVEARLTGQEGVVARAMIASGQPITFGRDYDQPTVTWTDGRGTQQLSGPRPPASAEGQADHARRVYDALELEAQPVRGALSNLERERSEALKAAGLIGGELGGVEGQIARIRAEEAARVELIGRVDWRARLSEILRRLSSGG